ncbi:MAG: hypothetical protein AB7Q00_08800 [Phycisphaerales bacterium]
MSKSDTADVVQVSPEFAHLNMTLGALAALDEIVRDYPDVLEPDELNDMAGRLEATLQGLSGVPEHKLFLKEMNSPDVMALPRHERHQHLYVFTLFEHPSLKSSQNDDKKLIQSMKALLERVKDKCPESTIEVSTTIDRIMLFRCIYPTGSHSNDFAKPMRAICMLCKYWIFANNLLVTQSEQFVAYRPHPFADHILSLKNRIRACFDRVPSQKGKNNAMSACDTLLDTLNGRDPTDLSDMKTWTDGLIGEAHDFIFNTLRSQLLGRDFSNTHAETFFFKSIELMIGQHNAKLTKSWNALLRNADNAKNAVSQPKQPPPDAMTPQPSSHRPAVALGADGFTWTVCGVNKGSVTDAQHAVLIALLEAGDKGLTKDALEITRASARRTLKLLRKDKDWAKVIKMAGGTNKRYRLLTVVDPRAHL